MLNKLLGGGLVDSVGKIVDELHTSEEEKAQAKIKLKELDNALNKAQTDINLADAKSTATGIGGIMQRSWRPLIGMSCALAIFWEFVLKQFIVFFLAVFEVETLDLPSLDMSVLMPLVMSLLGMATLRTYEKTRKDK
ncbi:conserved protein of unknown function [uncultured Mediterranean phage uvMED]|nr:conserved protein of unknown function [uncultured Mediterranean phage uvMED]